MQNTTPADAIARELVTFRDGTSLATLGRYQGSDLVAGGFVLRAMKLEDGSEGWRVSDGHDEATFTADKAADALRCYADYIQTFVGDDPEYDYSQWIIARDQARADADRRDHTVW